MNSILIVDDNRMILNSLSSFLGITLKNFSILTAEDGEKAIEILHSKSDSVSLILTDLEMPNVDGYQVIEYAKKNHPSIPVIIMTGSWSLDLELLVQKTGIMRCIEKPFHFEDIACMAIEALGESNTESSCIIAPTQPLNEKCGTNLENKLDL